jgi:hypothetical protein
MNFFAFRPGLSANTLLPSGGGIQILGVLWGMTEHGISLQKIHSSAPGFDPRVDPQVSTLVLTCMPSTTAPPPPRLLLLLLLPPPLLMLMHLLKARTPQRLIDVVSYPQNRRSRSSQASPFMAGGLFSVDRTFFLERLEGYDTGIRVSVAFVWLTPMVWLHQAG